jgi:hypothetical protein
MFQPRLTHLFSFLACALELAQGPRGVEEITKPDLWDALTRLSLDRVVDVRIGVGRLVASACGVFNTMFSLFPFDKAH